MDVSDMIQSMQRDRDRLFGPILAQERSFTSLAAQMSVASQAIRDAQLPQVAALIRQTGRIVPSVSTLIAQQAAAIQMPKDLLSQLRGFSASFMEPVSAMTSALAAAHADGMRIRDLFESVLPQPPYFEEALRQFREATHAGTFFGDVFLVLNEDADPADKWPAICRLQAKWFRTPLHPARWRLAQPELQARAQVHGTSLEAELATAVRQAIPLALDAAAEYPADDLLRAARSALANYLMDDLAGPGWRQRTTGRELPLDDELVDPPSDLNVEYEAEIRDLQTAFWQKVMDLPTRQRDAVLARLEGRPLSNAEHQALHRLRTSPRFVGLLHAVA